MGAVFGRLLRWLVGLPRRFKAWCVHAPGRFRRWAKANPVEVSGYVVWAGMAIAIGYPEIRAATDSEHVPWPTISGMTGHLEVEYVWVSFIVVAVLTWVASHAVVSARGVETPSGLRPDTETGRLTTTANPAPISPFFYFPFAAACVAIGIAFAYKYCGHDKYTFGEVMYGLLFFFAAGLPGLFAWRKRLVPFPTLFLTLKNLAEHMHVVTLLLASALLVLFIHLVFYPWPSLLPDFNRLNTTYNLCHPLEPRTKPLTQDQKNRCELIRKADQDQSRPDIQIKPSAYGK
jgi:hypothetical protein